jgi:hypothetical protein
MPFEITNTIKNTSTIRVVDTGTSTISLNDLRKNPTNEVVTRADIKRVYWSTNGSISIVRNGVPLLALHGSGEMRFDDFGYAIANNNTSSLVITVVTGGSIIVELSKQATFNVDPNTGQTL